MPGLWQTHELDFQFMGFTATYSCDGLADSLQLILDTIGVQKGSKVSPLCVRPFGTPDRLASAKLKFASLRPLEAGAAGSTPAEAQVPGIWRHIHLSIRKPYGLSDGDCELVEQFADKILPLFATRNIERRITCVPYQQSGSNYNLSFDAFVPAPVAAAGAKAPAGP